MRLLILVLSVLLTGQARAAESAVVTTARDTASLVSEADSFVPGQAFRLGLRLRLAPGWHTYWSNPGDAGAPPTLDITGAVAGAIVYPAPERLREGPFTSFAYTREVLFPVAATVTPAAGVSTGAAGAPKTAAIEAHATWLVCAKVCVPEEARFRLDLPAGSGASGAQAALFHETDAHTPRASPFAAHVSADGVLSLAAPHLALRDAVFFPAEAGVIDQGAKQVLSVTAEQVSLALTPLKRPLGALSGVLQLTDISGQVESLSVVATPAGGPAARDGQTDAGAAGAILGVGVPSAGLPGAAAGAGGDASGSQTSIVASGATAGVGASGVAKGAAASGDQPVAGGLGREAEFGSTNGKAWASGPGDGGREATLGGPAVEPGLLRALVLAFAGGLILNLMPCVLPVLAIKALALARLSGAARSHVRREAAFYVLGVLVAFCAIGGVTLVLRHTAAAAGWGVQFQSPVFTTATGWLLFGVGLNLSGVFMVGGQLAGAGQGLASRGSFFTGLLAVVVATPCTAPFMGAALAAALAMPAASGMLVFVALGLGLAAPYAALALSPAVASLLPRPGAWMEVLKQFLAFPMYAAALWMVWVASQQTDPTGLALVFGSFLLIALAAWAFGFAQIRTQAGAQHGSLRVLAVASAFGGVALLAAIGLDAPPAHAAQGVAADGTERFSAARLATLRAQRRPVLVDMSAAWCVTCLVNERVALGPKAVRDAFASANAVMLRGDWTRQDPEITAFLHRYDRSGVPLYVFYPISGGEEVLPQILTPGLVIERLRQKAG